MVRTEISCRRRRRWWRYSERPYGVGMCVLVEAVEHELHLVVVRRDVARISEDVEGGTTVIHCAGTVRSVCGDL